MLYSTLQRSSGAKEKIEINRDVLDEYTRTGDAVTSSIPVFHPGNARGVNLNSALAQGSVGASSRRVSPFYGSKESQFKSKSYFFRNSELY